MYAIFINDAGYLKITFCNRTCHLYALFSSSMQWLYMYFMHPKARRKEGAIATIPYQILLSLKVSLNTDIQLRFNCISFHLGIGVFVCPRHSKNGGGA